MNSLKNNMKWSIVYWCGTILQMGLVCIIKFLLEKSHIQYPVVFNFLFLLLGGTSSAIWGIIVVKKSGQVGKYIDILKDYFGMKQPMRLYGMIALFLMILFGVQIVTGKIVDGVMWYTFPMLFVQAVVFGGIEEVGWRYTFQPLVEKSLPFEIASIITFLSWGIWHYMCFYITNTISGIQHDTFLIGLLGSCFILGAIYRVGQSLWLCVLYHCLLNMFSQTMAANDLVPTIVCNVVCIFLAILVVRKRRGRREK